MTPLAARLGPRLAAIAEMVPPGRPFADIGTDHGRLPALLVRFGGVPRALACDRASAPLARARVTAERYHVADRVELRLGEGLAPIDPGEVDAAVIAGVGAGTIIEILAADPARTQGLARVILQPNFGHEVVRRWLVEHALQLIDERLVEDRGRFYTILAAAPARGPEPPELPPAGWDPASWAIGPFVLRRGGALLVRHLEQELARCETEIAGLARADAPDPARVAELAGRRTLLAAVLAKHRALSHPGST